MLFSINTKGGTMKHVIIKKRQANNEVWRKILNVACDGFGVDVRFHLDGLGRLKYRGDREIAKGIMVWIMDEWTGGKGVGR
jgi:hypothetical protein